MIKILGIIFIIISGSVGGYTASVKLSQKVRFTEEFMEFIKIIENEIRYTGSCLSDIIQNHVKDTPFYSYIKKCSDFVSEGAPFPDAWSKTFSNISKEVGITYELSQIIYSFGLNLGSSDIESQIAYCRHNYKLTEPYIKNLIEEKNSKGRVYKILGTCLGMAIALFFI